jgi:hypothetical protein
MSERVVERANDANDREKITGYVEKATEVVALIEELIELGNQLRKESSVLIRTELGRLQKTSEYKDSYIFDAMLEMFESFAGPRANATSYFEKRTTAIS